MYDLTKCLNLFTLVCLAVLTVYYAPTMAQKCTKRHKQEIFCSADYIAVVRVFRKVFTGNPDIANDIKVIKIHKLTPAGNNTLLSGRFYTPRQNEWNFIHLSFEKYYLVAVKGNTLNKCDYIEEVEPNYIKNKFSDIDPYACKCKVKTCSDNTCDIYATSRIGCKWSPDQRCATELHECWPHIRSSPSGFFSKCGWNETPKWKKCISKESNAI